MAGTTNSNNGSTQWTSDASHTHAHTPQEEGYGEFKEVVVRKFPHTTPISISFATTHQYKNQRNPFFFVMDQNTLYSHHIPHQDTAAFSSSLLTPNVVAAVLLLPGYRVCARPRVSDADGGRERERERKRKREEVHRY